MFEVHGSGTIMRHTPHVDPPAPPAPALCAVSGVVYRVDGSVVKNVTITFNSAVPQIIAGLAVQPYIVSAVTDAEGDLQVIGLVQGLIVQIVVSDNGVTYPPMSGLVPTLATADFSQLSQGVR